MTVVRVLLVDDRAPVLGAMSAVVGEANGFLSWAKPPRVSSHFWWQLRCGQTGPDGREPSRHRRVEGRLGSSAAAVTAAQDLAQIVAVRSHEPDRSGL